MTNSEKTSRADTNPKRWENLARIFALEETPTWVRYGLALAVVLIATVLKLLLNMLFNQANQTSNPFTTFFLAIILTAIYGGFGPTLLATLFSVVLANYFFTLPLYNFGFDSINSFVNAVVFCINGVIIALLCNWLRTAMQRAYSEISQRRVVQAQLEEQRENYAVTLASIGDAVIATNQQGHVTFLNNVAEDLTGWSQAAANGQPLSLIFKIVNEDTRATVENPVDRVLTEGIIVGLANHTILIARNGREIPIADSAAPIRTSAGQINGVVLVFRDVTEQQAAEYERMRLFKLEQAARAEAERANERISYLARASEVLAGSLDYAKTLQNLADLAVPEIADWCSVSMPGATPTSPIETVAIAHIDPTKIELIRKLRDRRPLYLDGPSGIPGVIRNARPEVIAVITNEMLIEGVKDKEELKIALELGLTSSMIVPILVNEKAIGTIAFAGARPNRHFSDADLAMAEELARRAAVALENARLYRAAQEAIADRDEFLSVAAHELKTPVTGIRGFAQLLRRQLTQRGQLDPARVDRALESIDTQSAKLTKLVERLLDLARLEGGKLVLEPENTDLVALVRGVVSSIQTNTEKHQFEIDTPENLLAVVDPIRLEQVVVNLLDNAIKYSPEGGRIEISLSELATKMIRFSVRDYGIGIAPDQRSRIFNRFFQAHERGYAGMGLGLYVSQQIVELHGGTIEAEFPDDGGTCFIITLPKLVNQNQQ